MPLPIIPKSLYPLVPNVAGVPALLRNSARILDTLTLGVLGIGNILGQEPVRWTILNKDGDPVADFDSIISVDMRSSSRISNYPVENGSFKSYNKVANPFDARVVGVRTGTETQRQEFIDKLQAAADSLELLTIVTPEATYENANIEAFDYVRETTNGAGMIKASLTFVEIRQKKAAKYSQAKSISAADPQAQGQVQTVDDPAIDVSGFA